MKAEVSCLNTKAIIDYLERRGIDPRPFFGGLTPGLDQSDDPYAYLTDKNNWVPQAVVTGLFARLVDALDDPQLPFRIGYESFTHRRFGYVQDIFIRLFVSPAQALRKAQKINDRFNRTKQVELVDLTDGKAVVRLHWFSEARSSKDVCLYNQGVYSAIFQAWGVKPASVTETQCHFEGGECCEFRLRWQPVSRVRGLLKNYFIPRSLFTATVKELEEDKELLSKKYREVQDLTSRLQVKIRELETIVESGKAVVSLLDKRELLGVIMRLTTKTLGYDRALVMLHDKEGERLVMVAASGGEKDLMKKFGDYSVPLERAGNILVRAFNSGKPALVNDPAAQGLNLENPLLKAFSPRSFVVIPLISRGHVVGIMAADRDCSATAITVEDMEYLSGFGNHVAVALENSRLYEDLEGAYIDAIQSLAMALEAKDPYTSGHSERVSVYSVRLAEAIGLPEGRMLNLKLACRIHDIGKIGVTERILHKPTHLNREEQTVIRQHPVMGETIIRPLKGLGDVARIIRHHHERFDGSGYPDRLEGSDIPLEARIMAIADCFDAMTTRRPYREPLPEEIVVKELRDNQGRQFDPYLVDSFFEIYQAGTVDWPTRQKPCLQ